MTDYNTDSYIEESQSPSSVPWERAQNGEKVSYDDIVRLDPALAAELQPIHGFITYKDGYRYSVKDYKNDGNCIVYRNKISGSTTTQAGYNSSRQSSSSNQLTNRIFNHTGLGSSGLDNESVKKISFKRVKFEPDVELSVEEGWEIYERHPFLPDNGESFMVLMKVEFDTKS